MTPRRAIFLLAGWLALGVALSPPLDGAAEESLTAHMAQHALLLGVVPPLLLLGEPVRVALDLLPARGARALLGALRWRPLALLLNPVAALLAFAAVVVVLHLPAVYDAALRSAALHGLEHLAYLAVGLLLWTAVLAADPTAKPLSPVAVVGLLSAAMVPMVAVGVGLATASGVVYDFYAAQPGGATAALAEQRSAATVMWAADLPFAAAIVLAGWAGVEREERRQRAREAALTPGAGRRP